MYNYHLADLDELILKCRDENVRLLVREAVACYRAGAYRACIIISWLALVRDFTIKIEILNRTDMTTYTEEVKRYYALYTRAQGERENNYSHSLNYENEVPRALKDLGYINKNQMEELQHIKKSRNACAHPYLAGSATEEYTPSAEQARYYLRIIVDYCLSVDPLHGQILIDKITEIVQRSDFPLDDQRSIKVLKEFFSRVNTPTMPKLITHILAKFKEEVLKEEVLEVSPSRWLICLKSLKRYNEAEFKSHFRDCFDNAELYQSTYGYILLMNYLQLHREEISEKDIAYLEDQFERWELKDFNKLYNIIKNLIIDEIIETFSVLENRIMRFNVNDFNSLLSYFSDEKQKKLCIRFLKENSDSVSVLDRLAKLVNIITFDDFLEISDIIKDNENNFFARPTRQFLQTFRSDSPIDENEKNDLLKQEHLIRISTGKFDDDIPF